MKRCLLVLLVIAGCSGGSSAHDASGSGDASACGSDLTFAGELVDWDSVSTGSDFCGVMGAVFQVANDTARTDTTPPNGRVSLCLAKAASTELMVTPPLGPSGCTTSAENQSYNLPGIAVANEAVLATGMPFSYRAFTSARETTFFQAVGVAFDPTAAQVLVNVLGTPRAVSLTGNHATTQAFDGTTWAAGSTGAYVFFPNVAIGGTPSETVSMTGTVVGAGAVPLVANTITYITLIAQ